MSRRLLRAGHDVTVWNRSAGKTAALVETGAKGAATPREVASLGASVARVPGLLLAGLAGPSRVR